MLLLVVGALAGGGALPAKQASPKRHLLIVLDGLLPDYVSPEVMPYLYALGQRGVVFARHHSMYPTVTRVNSASISTGAYPETHGLMGNSVFFPRVDVKQFLNTGDRNVLTTINAALDGGLLTATTLGETLQACGQRLLVVSSGGTGSALLLNHKRAGGPILHTGYALPESWHEATQTVLGEVPPSSVPNTAHHQGAS